MKSKPRVKNKSEMLSGSARLFPVILLIAAFIFVNIVLAAGKKSKTEAAESSCGTTEPSENSTIKESQTETSVSATAGKLDLAGVEVRIKSFVFSEFSEDIAAETVMTGSGLKIIIEKIHLDNDTFEATLTSELESSDFDIAYIPYKEGISVVKNRNLYKTFDLAEERNLLSFNGENIGIISRTYPAAGLFYNKRIIREAGLADPIKLFKKSSWDLASFYEYLKKTSIDDDNDGINDIFGIVISEDLTDSLAAAKGVQSVSVSSEGRLNLNVFTPGFEEVLNFINSIYSEGLKGGMSKQGFIDGRACFYNDDASVYTELKDVMTDDIGFICFPSDNCLVSSASAGAEIAVINKNKVIDEEFVRVLIEISAPEMTSEEYFLNLFNNADVAAMCTQMTQNNYISPLYMFKDLHDMYLDMLRDIKAGQNPSETAGTTDQTVTESSGD